MVFRRSETILEARLGLVTARVSRGGAELCEDTSAGQWVTVARPALPAPCPLQGSYTGRLPDGGSAPTPPACATASTGSHCGRVSQV